MKYEILKVGRLGWDRALRALPAPGEKAGKHSRGRQHGNSDVKNIRGTLGILFPLLESIPEG